MRRADYARARLREVCSTPAVSRADIDKAIRSRGFMRRFVDDSEVVEVDGAVDGVCALFGIEAEQAVDPVEAKVTTRHPENYRLVNEADGSEWRMARDGSWKRAEASSDE